MRDDLRRQYQSDPRFHAIVQALVDALLRHEVSIEDVRGAANLAINLYVMHNPAPFVLDVRAHNEFMMELASAQHDLAAVPPNSHTHGADSSTKDAK